MQMGVKGSTKLVYATLNREFNHQIKYIPSIWFNLLNSSVIGCPSGNEPGTKISTAEYSELKGIHENKG